MIVLRDAPGVPKRFRIKNPYRAKQSGAPDYTQFERGKPFKTASDEERDHFLGITAMVAPPGQGRKRRSHRGPQKVPIPLFEVVTPATAVEGLSPEEKVQRVLDLLESRGLDVADLLEDKPQATEVPELSRPTGLTSEGMAQVLPRARMEL